MRFKRPDLWVGLLLMGFAGAYFASADNITDSLLTDEVGAAGLPKLLAVALGFCGALLAVSGLAVAAPPEKLKIEAKSLALAVMVGCYIALLDILGYVFGISALIASCAIFAGARPVTKVIGVAVGGAILFQLIFVWLLHVPMPKGIILNWI